METKIEDISGKKYHRWTVIKFSETKHSHPYFECICECGTRRNVSSYSLKSGGTKSCGCLLNEILSSRSTHGESKTKANTSEYRSWGHLIARCTNPNDKAYTRYGGRGIKVCDRWRNSYADFLSDMGRRPSPKHSLDRINVNGDYEPSNCRWATDEEQANNTRANRIITYNGKSQTLQQWSREVEKDSRVIGSRLKAGWSIEDALYKAIDRAAGRFPKQKRNTFT